MDDVQGLEILGALLTVQKAQIQQLSEEISYAKNEQRIRVNVVQLTNCNTTWFVEGMKRESEPDGVATPRLRYLEG